MFPPFCGRGLRAFFCLFQPASEHRQGQDAGRQQNVRHSELIQENATLVFPRVIYVLYYLGIFAVKYILILCSAAYFYLSDL